MTFWFMREKRFEPPHVLYAGKRRVGKSLLIARDFIKRKSGVHWYANMELLDPRTGYQAGRIYCWEHLMELESVIVGLDEINLWANSHEWQAIPPEYYTRWAMSGKAGVGFVMTCHSTSDVAKPLRNLVDTIVICRRDPLRDSIDPRLPYVQTCEVDTIQAADRVMSHELDAGEYRRERIPAICYDAFATGETQAMQIQRKQGASYSDLPIRHPRIIDLETGAVLEEWDPTTRTWRDCEESPVPFPAEVSGA